MPRPCGHCNKVGHGKKDCPDLLEKKAQKKAGKKTPKPAAARTRRSPAAEPAASSNGHAPLTDNAARKSGEEFLGHLERLRDTLDTKITGIRELLAVL